MIPKECKRLAEVDFPIAMLSKHAPAGGLPGDAVGIGAARSL